MGKDDSLPFEASGLTVDIRVQLYRSLSNRICETEGRPEDKVDGTKCEKLIVVTGEKSTNWFSKNKFSYLW